MNAVNPLKSALPTSRNAEILLATVSSELGHLSHIETADAGRRMRMFVRNREEPEWIVPWPLLPLPRGRRLGHIMGAEGPTTHAAPPAGDVPPPRLLGLPPGELAVAGARHEITLTFGGNGRVAKTARCGPEEALAPGAEVLRRGDSNAVGTQPEPYSQVGMPAQHRRFSRQLEPSSGISCNEGRASDRDWSEAEHVL